MTISVVALILLMGCSNSFEVVGPCESVWNREKVSPRVIKAIKVRCPSNEALISISSIDSCPHEKGSTYYIGEAKTYKVECIHYPREFIK